MKKFLFSDTCVNYSDHKTNCFFQINKFLKKCLENPELEKNISEGGVESIEFAENNQKIINTTSAWSLEPSDMIEIIDIDLKNDDFFGDSPDDLANIEEAQEKLWNPIKKLCDGRGIGVETSPKGFHILYRVSFKRGKTDIKPFKSKAIEIISSSLEKRHLITRAPYDLNGFKPYKANKTALKPIGLWSIDSAESIFPELKKIFRSLGIGKPECFEEKVFKCDIKRQAEAEKVVSSMNHRHKAAQAYIDRIIENTVFVKGSRDCTWNDFCFKMGQCAKNEQLSLSISEAKAICREKGAEAIASGLPSITVMEKIDRSVEDGYRVGGCNFELSDDEISSAKRIIREDRRIAEEEEREAKRAEREERRRLKEENLEKLREDRAKKREERKKRKEEEFNESVSEKISFLENNGITGITPDFFCKDGTIVHSFTTYNAIAPLAVEGNLFYDQKEGKCYKLDDDGDYNAVENSVDLVSRLEEIAFMSGFSKHALNIKIAEPIITKEIKKHPVNVVHERFLKRRVEWDGIHRVKDFFTHYLGAEPSNYTRYSAFAFLIKLYMAHSGTDFAELVAYNPVIIGSQGVGKSCFAKHLVSDETRDAEFCVLPQVTGFNGVVDAHRAEEGKIICEIEELQGFKKADSDTLKSFLTASSWTRNVKFVEDMKTATRTAFLVGTSNDVNFLRPEDGGENRRLFPIMAGKVSLEEMGIENDSAVIGAVIAERMKQDLPQLIAEGEFYYKRLNEDDLVSLYKVLCEFPCRDINKNHQYLSTVRSALEVLLNKNDVYRSEEISAILKNPTMEDDKVMFDISSPTSNAISNSMRALGWEYVSMRGGKFQKVSTNDQILKRVRSSNFDTQKTYKGWRYAGDKYERGESEGKKVLSPEEYATEKLKNIVDTFAPIDEKEKDGVKVIKRDDNDDDDVSYYSLIDEMHDFYDDF